MANKGPHILELELVDGYGERSDFYYYLTTVDNPVTREDLTAEALADLHKNYPNEKRICNGGYHHWKIMVSGPVSDTLYNYYKKTVEHLEVLRGTGFRIK